MKKIIFTLLALVGTMSMNAQKVQEILIIIISPKPLTRNGRVK